MRNNLADMKWLQTESGDMSSDLLVKIRVVQERCDPNLTTYLHNHRTLAVFLIGIVYLFLSENR